MWQPEGDKLPTPDRLGNLAPITVLSDIEGPAIFTCKDPNDDLLLAYRCGEEAGVRRFIVVPFSDEWVSQLQAGTLGLREALAQPRTWLVDVDAAKKPVAAWRTSLSKVPESALPPPGTMLLPVAEVVEALPVDEEIPMGVPVATPVASAPPVARPAPAAAAPVAQAVPAAAPARPASAPPAVSPAPARPAAPAAPAAPPAAPARAARPAATPAGQAPAARPAAQAPPARPAAAPAVPPRPAAPAPAAQAPAAVPAAPATPAPAARPVSPPSGKYGRINIERMTHRNAILVSGESAMTYFLVKLIPAGDVKGPPLNLALVLDVSGSMAAEDGTGLSRFRRIQEAAKLAIQKFRPDDTISIVAFGYDAKVLLPPTPVADKARIDEIIDNIDNLGVDPGGTAMDEGIKLGLEAVQQNFSAEKLNQVVVLTDGETTGETFCRDLSNQAADKKIPLTMIGIGTDWNASLLKDMARVSLGKWHYIDVNEAKDAERVIATEFASLASAGFLNVEMHIRAVKNVKVKRVRQVAPEIRVMAMEEPEERHLVIPLGTLERDKSTKYILDVSVPKRPDGKYAIAQMEISWDSAVGKREGLTVPLEITYSSSGQSYINAEVARHIDEVQVAELNESLQQAIAKDDKGQVQKLAEALVKKGDLMGPRAAKKTMLAKQVLQEINVGGRVSKKTQLAMDDAARVAAE
jgi:Ca-activated chloride channel family protein